MPETTERRKGLYCWGGPLDGEEVNSVIVAYVTGKDETMDFHTESGIYRYVITTHPIKTLKLFVLRFVKRLED